MWVRLRRWLAWSGRVLVAAQVYVLGLFSLTAALAGRVSPQRIWWLELFALAWPYLYLLTAGGLLLGLLVWRKRKLWWLVPGLLAGAFHIPSYVGTGRGQPTKGPGTTVKVMSYNVRLFDFYDWSGNPGTGRRMISLVAEEHPDVLCVQELSTAIGPHYTQLDSLREVFGLPYVHFQSQDSIWHKYRQGMATFTRYPIVGGGIVPLTQPSHNRSIYTDLLIGADTVRVYNVHLQSHRFKKADSRLFEDHEFPEQEVSGVLARIHRSVPKRAEQADELLEHMRHSPFPVILCGDLNDPPASYVYRTLSTDLTDAFTESGRGFGRTYNGVFPSFRIDCILHAPSMRSSGFRTLPHKLSDHYPVVCTMQLPAG
jgi:endonuclease/exonuclease/phosphatase family metal-dependent hydrolase